ncbi:hypothetical protein ACXDF8_25500 [Mycolicibacterium sp. CBM1]
MDDLLDKLRQALEHEVSIEALIEAALWLAVPYLLIGLTWAFFHAEQVGQLHDHLQRMLPAGAEAASYAVAAVLWPALLVLPPICSA